jgi:hypothetical protein
VPEDKDFKRLVRARMSEEGERYTTARTHFRQEPAARTAGEEAALLPKIVPMDLVGLEAWRAERPRPVPGQHRSSLGTDWELSVDVGGPLKLLEPPAVDVAAVAALGRALAGVGYLAFGLHVLLPAPEGSDPDDPKAPPMEQRHATLLPLQEAQAELDQVLRDRLALELPHPNEFTVGRPRRQDGAVVVPGRSTTTVFLTEQASTPGVGERLEPSKWLELPEKLPGMPWAAYGVVLRVEHDFPVELVPRKPPPHFTGPQRSSPVVGDEFWEACGAVLRSVGPDLGLPVWPLRQGQLYDPEAGVRSIRNWQDPA